MQLLGSITPKQNTRMKFSRKFKKQYEKAPKNIQTSFQKKLVLFQKNKFQPMLNNHALTGELKGLRSINVTGDWRAVFKEDATNGVIFELLGTHSQLYK